MQRKLTQMLHLVREPVGIYFANTTAVCDMDAIRKHAIVNIIVVLLLKTAAPEDLRTGWINREFL